MLETQMPDTASPLIDGLVARLCADFQVDAEMVALQASAIVRDRYAGARVQSFIPILVERELRDLLRAGRATGAAAG